MNIVYDHQIFASQVYGGVSRYFTELCSRLSAIEGVNVKVLAPLYVNEYLRYLNKSIVMGIHVPRIRKTAWLLRRLNNIICHFLPNSYQADIVHHTHYYNSHLPKQKHTKTLVTVHDMIYEKFPQYFSDSVRMAIKKKQAVEHADHVICISETTRRDLIEITGINPDKVSVVYLGIKLHDQISEPEEKYNVINGAFILYTGARTYYKNFGRLLKAYASVQNLYLNYKLVCFGGGPFISSELHLLRRLGMGKERVIWLKGSDAMLAKLYRNASVFVYPSLYEGFGFPPLEAMSYGCPVVCSTGGAIPEIVGDAGKYFDPYDENSIASAILDVVSNTKLAEKLSLQGREHAARFTWDVCADRIYKVYKSLMNE